MRNRVLALIPARGGSSRVPRKNIRDLGGKPLIAHTIEDALNSEVVDDTVVSTDDDEIAAISEEWGAEVPFRRPKELATDTSPTSPVVRHALDWLESNRGEDYNILVLLQATSPFRKPEDIDKSIRKLSNTNGSSLISTTEYSVPPQWAISENSNGFLQPHCEDSPLWSASSSRSQDFDLKHPNGAIFATYTDRYRETGTFYTEKTVGYEMPRKRSIDIDEPIDLEIARALISEDK
ncbi:acylneuraminate cytidylyltransferase family protein [Halalkaliarchaeum sp. AArc-GB]|uniref:acylneuraminate cytidylyltransferase family protein n=1 Tax=Halalkaliarchaeum sp. AArc-GB TaxID=3074078 RepID=UPI00285B926E|nr:acylneuraminate cytidylyltransferase family protein [Halalkaliarchaeum sp. AArc-GB]MDR5674228.1 acylneuraminate cytidylyltransferase family protein [Halalkaliarchaeum sp. AArc-GB]